MSKEKQCADCEFCAVAENIDMSGYCPIGDTSTCNVEPKSIRRSQFAIACRLFKDRNSGGDGTGEQND